MRHINIRKAILRLTEYCHAALILALIFPTLYCLVGTAGDPAADGLYAKCMLIAFPVAAVDICIGCRRLLTYLCACAAIAAATAGIGFLAAGTMESGMAAGYLFFLVAETIFVIAGRLAERLRSDRDDGPVPEGGADYANANKGVYRHMFRESLMRPSPAALIFFAAAYIIALNLNQPRVCDAALFGAACYAVIFFLHRFVSDTEGYLALNNRTSSVPSRRIYGIGGGMVAMFLLALIIVSIPSFAAGRYRHYSDLREAVSSDDADPVELMPEPLPTDDIADMSELFGEPEEYAEPPAWLDGAFYLLAAIGLAAFAAMLLHAVLGVFRAFRESSDENGDLVEDLKDADPGVKIAKKRLSPGKRDEREKIRREYRRFIRHYRTDRPACHEAPEEIESAAGVLGSAACADIHERYEAARYGRPDS